MTTFTPNNQDLRETSLEKATRRFNRKNTIDRSLLKRSGSISSETSQTSLHMFYTHSSKISNKKQAFSSSNLGIALQKSHLGGDYAENTKRKEEEEVKNKNTKEEQRLKRQIIGLKDRNKELELKLESVQKVLQEQTKREGRHANKMRQSIQKQRMKELEMQNKALKKQIEELKQEIFDAKSSKNTEETSNSINECENVCSFNFIEEQLNSEKQIFALNQTIKSLHIQINSLKRRNHSDIQILKMNNEKQFQLTKQKLIGMFKDNSSLKKKNLELRNLFKKQESLTCGCIENKMERSKSLLSLSSDE